MNPSCIKNSHPLDLLVQRDGGGVRVSKVACPVVMSSLPPRPN